jgi:hypothetical protein
MVPGPLEHGKLDGLILGTQIRCLGTADRPREQADSDGGTLENCQYEHWTSSSLTLSLRQLGIFHFRPISVGWLELSRH